MGDGDGFDAIPATDDHFDLGLRPDVGEFKSEISIRIRLVLSPIGEGDLVTRVTVGAVAESHHAGDCAGHCLFHVSKYTHATGDCNSENPTAKPLQM